METLYLYCNTIITNDGIKDMTQMQSLNFGDNYLNINTDNGIKGMIQMQTLNLNHNTNITDNGIKGMTQMQTLYL